MDGGLSMFKVPMKQLESGWYDGYQGEEVLWFDEFRGGTMKPQHFLELLDGLDRLPIKGSFIPNQSKYLFFASPDHPINWWLNWYKKDPNNWAQVKRRLDKIYSVAERVVTDVTSISETEFKKEESTEIHDYKPKFND